MFKRIYYIVFKGFDLIKKTFMSSTEYARSLGVEVGENNKFFSVEWSSEPYLIKVGSNCRLTKGVKIFTHGGANVLRQEYPNFDVFGRVEIKDNVYIGNNTLIMPGVTIGNNVLVAAGSVVTKSVPDNVCIGGNPAVIICSLDEFKAKNLPYNLNSKKLNAKEKRELLLTIDETKLITKGFLKSTK